MNLADIIHYIAPIIGFFTLVIGISAFAKPEAMSKNFGIQASGQALPYVMSTGIRDVFMGLVMFILFFMQLWQAMAAVSLCIGLVAICDFIIVQKYGDKKMSMVHLAGASAVIGYGIVLFVI